MFNSLYGKLTGKDPDRVYLLSGGIEWDISVSNRTSGALPEEGAECRVFCFLYHREDSLRLFGFGSLDERDLFLDLIKVEGIGPSLALKILSGIAAEEFVRAVGDSDCERLSMVPGLGKKTAQKIVLKLAGKLSPRSQKESGHEDIVKALNGMGFDMAHAREAVARAADSLGKTDDSLRGEQKEKALLKAALVYLSGGRKES
ncbi:MAG: Holliday junction branch migration protein RuvA [Spirochaetales bacterium]|nr:Holliday junction branch migration protein RuvA [Spirochaetales bacterium]